MIVLALGIAALFVKWLVALPDPIPTVLLIFGIVFVVLGGFEVIDERWFHRH